MGQPASRLGDMHVCPLVNVLVPHVGGPIVMASVNVFTGGQPQARVGDLCICVGPPDVIALGSTTVLVNGQLAARIGDLTAHGGTIVGMWPTVLIGG
ncbi:PAAR domain-containing protein [Labrys portucalensis]|uniref:PAAR domain-containing protein n=1 Tax=Labrys neptuniae TaxID=376174 RepID=A0ABV6ZJ64_9HYPH|nr:PAAR domain-containing protein [Labrys neptuniae]MDT3381435.1 PAAR domain-containing protein [Labrys neptuniae]